MKTRPGSVAAVRQQGRLGLHDVVLDPAHHDDDPVDPAYAVLVDPQGHHQVDVGRDVRRAYSAVISTVELLPAAIVALPS
jgi:hypothetical protein